MSIIDNMEEVEREIRELILNSKAKRSSSLEPCTPDNLPAHLKAIQEKMLVVGIPYHYNPYDELPVPLDPLLRLANAAWGLLQRHHRTSREAAQLKEHNTALQQNNFFLNNIVEKLKEEVQASESRARAAEEAKRSLSVAVGEARDGSHSANSELRATRARLAAQVAQAAATRRRHEREYALLQDKFRGQCGMYTSKNDAKNTYVEEYRAKEKKYKEAITKLQSTNKQLLQEVISMREDILAQDSSGTD